MSCVGLLQPHRESPDSQAASRPIKVEKKLVAPTAQQQSQSAQSAGQEMERVLLSVHDELR